MERSSISISGISRSPTQINAISVPKVKEPLLKRPFDVILSLFMLILSAPISLVIAFAIKLEDGGPIFYRQERWGRGGGENEENNFIGKKENDLSIFSVFSGNRFVS